MDISHDDLEFFLALWETRSITQAARDLNLTMPTASRRMYMYQSPLETDYADDVDSDETTEEAAEKALQSATADIAAEEMTTTTIITTAEDAA